MILTFITTSSDSEFKSISAKLTFCIYFIALNFYINSKKIKDFLIDVVFNSELEEIKQNQRQTELCDI